MALFQSSVLKDHLRLQEARQVDEAYQKFTAFFHNPEIQENIRSSKEEQQAFDYKANQKGCVYVVTSFVEVKLCTAVKKILIIRLKYDL